MNEIVRRGRETAVSLLQPSASQLDHGLALHSESLVIDTYGFAPRAVVDNVSLLAAAGAGASPYEIEQLSHEMSMLGMIDDSQQRHVFTEAFEAAGVTCILQNAGEENNDIEILLRRLGRFTHAADMMPEVLRRATQPDDIVRTRDENKYCLYLSTNGVPLPRQFRSAEEGLNYIRTFFQLGVRMMHLTYNRRNLIGDGCGETTNAGLSEFGHAVVEEMNRVGVLIDIAHSGVQTGLDAARHSQKPIVISHATCSALSEHYRAKPDELIRAVADTGGLIGICCIPIFLQRSGDINALLDHIDHVVRLVGVDHVAIGTDVAAHLQEPPTTRRLHYPEVAQTLRRYGRHLMLSSTRVGSNRNNRKVCHGRIGLSLPSDWYNAVIAMKTYKKSWDSIPCAYCEPYYPDFTSWVILDSTTLDNLDFT